MAAESIKGTVHSERVYQQLRQDIFQFILLPGDRFTEVDIAARLGCSRTPVREALLLLQNEHLVRRIVRNGWEVYPLDFEAYEALYEVRTLIERHAVGQLTRGTPKADRRVIAELQAIWSVPDGQRCMDSQVIETRDEQFHIALSEAAGNHEMTRILINITDRIRLMRRLDFDYEARIIETYEEHSALLAAMEAQDIHDADQLIEAHIRDAFHGASALTLRHLQRVRQRRPVE